jgi:hypothetical protein
MTEPDWDKWDAALDRFENDEPEMNSRAWIAMAAVLLPLAALFVGAVALLLWYGIPS